METLTRVERMDSHGHRVLSVYMGFDPSQMPNLRERRIELDSLLAEAERRYGGDEEITHSERMALREDIRMVRELLADQHELAPEAARGLAIFCSAPAGIHEIIKLPESVDPVVVLDERPFIEPLLELAAPERWCVLLVSHRASRIFTGTRAHLVEVAGLLDDVHRRHSQGGWSQARYQRGIEMETAQHIRGTCAILLERLQRRAFGDLLVGGPAELHHRIEGELQPELRRRLAGCFEIDVERAAPTEVLARATPLIEAQERRREHEALSRLEEGLAPVGHGAVGLDEVLELLNEGRVQTLLVARGFAAPGFRCPLCGRLSTTGSPCPLDGTMPERREDVVESAIELALDRSAEVLIVWHELDRLAAHAPIAAMARY
jgi:peptide chain release factor subunit 1